VSIENWVQQHGSDNDDQRRGGWPKPPSTTLLLVGAIACGALAGWSITNALRRGDAAGWAGAVIVAGIFVAFVASLVLRWRAKG
jgi:hypothetical protein